MQRRAHIAREHSSRESLSVVGACLKLWSALKKALKKAVKKALSVGGP
jgi:hypothetical protein